MANLRDIDAVLDIRFAGQGKDYPREAAVLAVGLYWALEELENAGLYDAAADVLRRLAGPKEQG